MRPITKEMIEKYKINELGYDFMGYTFSNEKELNFHHLIVPKRDCLKKDLGDGYIEWNGAILNKNTSHPYLHAIEATDRTIFLEITKEMIEENLKGKLTLQNLKNIRELLLWFEIHYKDATTSCKKEIIKPTYKIRRINIEQFEKYKK